MLYVVCFGACDAVVWRIVAANGSMNKANSDGKSEHSCLVRLHSVNFCEANLFVMTVAIGEL